MIKEFLLDFIRAYIRSKLSDIFRYYTEEY